jgi:hypothetical protein
MCELVAMDRRSECLNSPGTKLGSVLIMIQTYISMADMTRARRITANLPENLLEDAMHVTGKGITDTLVEGLRLVRRARGYEKAMALRGKVRLTIDLEESRERRRG